MIEGQSHFQPFGLSCWCFADLNKGVGSMTASYDYHIGVDYHKSYSHFARTPPNQRLGTKSIPVSRASWR